MRKERGTEGRGGGKCEGMEGEVRRERGTEGDVKRREGWRER